MMASSPSTAIQIPTLKFNVFGLEIIIREQEIGIGRIVIPYKQTPFRFFVFGFTASDGMGPIQPSSSPSSGSSTSLDLFSTDI